MATPSPPSSMPGRFAGFVLLAIFVAIAALVFVGLYLTIQTAHQYWALFAIGLVALLFAVVSYFSQALSREPLYEKALAYGFAAFGFGILFLSTLLFPFLYAGLLSTTVEVELLILLLVLVAVPVAGAMMGSRHRASDVSRAEARATWRSSTPPSALDYPAAQTPASKDPPTPPRGS